MCSSRAEHLRWASALWPSLMRPPPPSLPVSFFYLSRTPHDRDGPKRGKSSLAPWQLVMRAGSLSASAVPTSSLVPGATASNVPRDTGGKSASGTLWAGDRRYLPMVIKDE